MFRSKLSILILLIAFGGKLSFACDAYVDFCLSGSYISNESIVIGTISSSAANSIELDIMNVMFGSTTAATVRIWDGTTIQCNGPWPNDANDMGTVGDTVLAMIQPITTIENPWDVPGEYRRPSLLGGDTYTNFSIGALFEGIYIYDEVVNFNFSQHCCDNFNQNFFIEIYDLPTTAGSTDPIPLTGFPTGGTFSGPGVFFNTFNPTIAGPGTHTISYTIDDEFGCSFTTTEEILVFNVTYNFVDYNLGTISPKFGEQIDLKWLVESPDRYVFRIVDLSGRQIYFDDQQYSAGLVHKQIELPQDLPHGIYVLNVSNAGSQHSTKFLLSR